MKRGSGTLYAIIICFLSVVLFSINGTWVFAAPGMTLEGKTFSAEGWNNFHAQVDVLLLGALNSSHLS